MSERSRVAALVVLVSLLSTSAHCQEREGEQPLRGDSSEGLIDQSGTVEGQEEYDLGPLAAETGGDEYSLRMRTRVRFGLEPLRATREGLYPGSPAGTYERVELDRNGGIKGSILTAKDPGEARMADFLSGYAELNNAGPFSTILLGDYFIESGQGLALWRGLEYGKGPDVLKPGRRKGRGIIHAATTNEQAFLSGGAAAIRWNRLSAEAFVSRRHLSGTLDERGYVTSLYTTGLFRTDAEGAKRGILREDLAGLSASVLLGERSNAGLTMVKTRFSHPLSLAGGTGLEGDGGTIVSANCQVALPGTVVFGEWMPGRSPAMTAGALLTPSAGIDLLALFRRYPAHQAGLHALGFGEGSGTSGEEGMYFGFTLRVAPWVHFGSFYDQFELSGGTSAGSLPRRGREVFTRLALSFTPDCRCLLQYQRKTLEMKRLTSYGGGLVRALTNEESAHRFRFHIELGSPHEFRFRGRIEKVFIENTAGSPHEEGVIAYQDLASAEGRALSASVRIIFFRTGSYESRLSESEEGLSGAASVPALFGEGERWYFLLNTRVSTHLEATMKYSRLTRDDLRHLGSGPDLLPGNEDDRIALGVDLRF
jgi:hypothetical protein